MPQSPAPELRDFFEGFAFSQVASVLRYHNYVSHETRNLSTFRLISNALERYPVPDFDWVLVNTSDRDDWDWLENSLDPSRRAIAADDRRFKVFSCCFGSPEHYIDAVPDFVYDHWRQTGMDDYEETRIRLSSIGAPETNLLGWRGANIHPGRQPLVDLDDKTSIDAEFVVWDRSNPDRLTAVNFMSLEEQVSRWRFLVDAEGNGYSGRLKLLLQCPRVVFIQDRPYKEDFFPHLVPWQHYVPVSRDFSDLHRHMEIVLSDPSLERLIVESARDFAQTYLTREAAEKRWAYRLKMHLKFGY